MEYRQLGSSDLNLSVVTFGAWAAGGMMWGGTDHRASIQAMLASYHLGVTTFDTAPVYGMGYSEQLVGEAIKDLPREKVQILTKFGLSWDSTVGEYYFDSVSNEGKTVKIYKNARKETIIRECETSLRNLGTDYIDLYQIHWADPTTPVGESMEAVLRLIEQGKVRYAGVCNYSVELLEEASRYVTLVSNQVPYSMVRRGIEKEILPYCLDKGLGVLAYSPLQRGLLTGKMQPGHAFAANDSRIGQIWYKPENLKIIQAFLGKLQPMAEAKNVSIGQLVLRWTLEQPGITVALVGARNRTQAEQNAGAANVELTSDELSRIGSELETLYLVS
jgi:aryl-alcohol dehydrogenase-like predicted oxidoreductase